PGVQPAAFRACAPRDRRQPTPGRAAPGYQPEYLAKAARRPADRPGAVRASAVVQESLQNSLALLQQDRCNLATMVTSSSPDSVPQAHRASPRWWRRSLVAARRANLYLWLEIVAAVALAIMLAISFFALTGGHDSTRLVPSAQAAAMLVGTLIPAMALVVLFGRRLAIRRAGGTTARLHVNLVFFFSLVAAVPTLLVAIFASILFQTGVAFWNSDSARGLFENANQLAQGYYEQSQEDVRL